MNILMILIAFGSGVVSTGMGALAAFILCGFMCIPASLLAASGVDTGFLGHAVNTFTFGPFLGPYVAWASGVAAAAYAGKKGYIETGADIVTPLCKFGDAKVLLVGGIFGALGQILLDIFTMIGIAPLTDGGALVVVTSAIIARLLFGKTGLTGKYEGTEPRKYTPDGKEMMYHSVLGGGIGLMTGAMALVMIQGGVSDVAMGYFPFVCFGFAASMFFMTPTGNAVPATHHLAYPSASAAIVGITAFGPGGIVLGVIFGICAALFGDFIGKTFNSYVDSHIDPPAVTIVTCFFVLTAIKMLIL